MAGTSLVFTERLPLHCTNRKLFPTLHREGVTSVESVCVAGRVQAEKTKEMRTREEALNLPREGHLEASLLGSTIRF